MLKNIFNFFNKLKTLLTFSVISACISIMMLVSYSLQASQIQQNLKFEHLTVADGLSQNSTYSIAQDKEGFLWFATQDGLNRYDGENIVQYRKNNSNPNSIADNFIRKVFVDSKNNLWVGTENGLSKYNPDKDSFNNFYTSTENSNTLIDNLIWDIYEDKQGTILVSTEGGLHKYIEKENYFVRIRFRGFENKILAIKTIYQDDNHNYWLGTFENGIYIANSKLNSTHSLLSKNPWNLSIDANTLFDITKINNEYWVGTDNGLFIVDDSYSISSHLNANNLSSKMIRSVINVNKNEIWLGTENGINILNNQKELITTLQKENHPKSLTNNIILDMFIDTNKHIWIGAYDGINFLNKNQSLLNHLLFNYSNANQIIDTIAESVDGRIWFSSDLSGLNVINLDNSLNQIHLDVNGPFFDIIPEYTNIWLIDKDENLYLYNTLNLKLTKYDIWKKTSNYQASERIVLINKDIWFIDKSGDLSQFNVSTQDFTRHHYENAEIINFTHFNQKIWATTLKNELITFDLNSKKYEIQPIKDTNGFLFSATNQIKVFNNLVWLGSTSQGIALVNAASNKITIFNEKNQLSNNFINSILLTEQGEAWCATNKGLSFIDPISQKVTNFYKDFNLNDNEFIEGSALKSSNNTYYFGGYNGIHSFKPDSLLKLENTINKPILTQLLIANKKISIENTANAVLKNSLISNNTVTLSYQQSPFSFEFISPNNNFSERIKYRYRLIGLETKWIDSGEDNRRATYTNLSAGNYTFEVEAYDPYDPTNIQTTSLPIKILPPWWTSNGALFFYSIIFLMIIAYFVQQLRYKHQYNLQIKESEERLKLSLWGSGDEMWDWNISSGKIYRSNIWGILEFPQDGERNIGTEQTNIHTADLDRVKIALKDHFEEKTDHFEVTYRVKDKNDNWIWVLDRGKIVEKNNNNQASRMTGTLKDISGIKKAEEKLKLFAKCIESISDAIVIYDRQFVIVDTNKAFEYLANKSKEKIIGTSMKFPQYSKEFNQNIKKQLLTQNNWSGEIEHKRGDKGDSSDKYITELHIDIIRDEHGKVSHFVGVFSDITERKKNEAELRKLANTDTLTELPNRSFFQANQIKLVNNKVPHALLVFDLDNFKKINDSMGHEMGDILLCKVAKRLLSIGRLQDTVYRLGGDEFSMIIENTNDIHIITSIAKDILRTIAIPLKLRSQEVVLFSSIGIVLYPEDGVSSEELLKNADTAMYHAKGLGGNKYQFFNESMNKQAVKRLQIENLIRHGLKEDYFSVFYQPKIEIKTGKVAGMEALVRFETPNKGIISPNIFIPVSEETGQIVEIGEVVLRKACYATKKWLDGGLFTGRVAVNLSAVQFSQPNLVSLIAQILLQSGLPAKHLELEITEGTVMDSPQRAIETMLQIRSMGIHLSLDDFGTGYSSLAYLKKFPLNTLKIDKAFVDDIEESDQGRNMVATIVTIAHNLGLNVVAEGVETENQLNFLSSLKCEQMQGFLYSKPLPEQHFTNYLLSHSITDKSTSFKI